MQRVWDVSGFQRPGRIQRESRASESLQVACARQEEKLRATKATKSLCKMFVMPLEVLSSLLSGYHARDTPEMQLSCCQCCNSGSETLALGEFRNDKTIPEIHKHNLHSEVSLEFLEEKPVQNPGPGREELEMGKNSCLVPRHVCKM